MLLGEKNRKDPSTLGKPEKTLFVGAVRTVFLSMLQQSPGFRGVGCVLLLLLLLRFHLSSPPFTPSPSQRHVRTVQTSEPPTTVSIKIGRKSIYCLKRVFLSLNRIEFGENKYNV